MSDLMAALLAATLLLVALESYRRRDALQPNRAGAALYLAGSLAWGIAVVMLWAAWAATGAGDVCADGACESFAETLEGAEAAGELLAGPEALGEVLTD